LVVDSTEFACGDGFAITIFGHALHCPATFLVTCALSICLPENAAVCGVSPDGTRRTYRNACEACQDPSLKGWWEGACPEL
jgi:hypothetical protein